MTGKDDAFLITIRFLAVATFATSVMACFSSYHAVTIDERTFVERLFGYTCEDLDADERAFCEGSHNTRFYSFWRVFDNFFSLGTALINSETGGGGGGFCGQFQVPLFNASGDLGTLMEGNIGQCTKAAQKTVAAFAVLTCICASFLAIYITVLADVILCTKYARSFHSGMMALIVSTFTCSMIVIITYTFAIDPFRLDPTFCQEQALFSYCHQAVGSGFWLQVSTFGLAFIALVFEWAWGKFGSPPGTMEEPLEAQVGEQAPEITHAPFYKSLHFWVQVVRFSELSVLIIGILSMFARVRTTISPNTTGNAFARKGLAMDTIINLWQGLFCHAFGERLFQWSIILEEQFMHEPAFGRCSDRELLEVQMGYILALVTAVMAISFEKDAKNMPLFYMIGFVMHFLSLVKLGWAIGAFMTKVYPGRSSIDPSYCSLWTSYLEGSTCSIKLGIGFVLTCVALGTVLISFIGECVVQSGHEYGVRSAFDTLLGRVREGRLKDLHKASSARVVGDSAEDRMQCES